MTSASLLTPRQAAQRLGIGYAKLKRWILAGRFPTIKTPGGHHRIPIEVLNEFFPSLVVNSGGLRIDGCNRLAGTVVEVTVEGLVAKVVLTVGQAQRVTAIITADAVREIDLKQGDEAVALFDPTHVMIGRA